MGGVWNSTFGVSLTRVWEGLMGVGPTCKICGGWGTSVGDNPEGRRRQADASRRSCGVGPGGLSGGETAERKSGNRKQSD